MFLKLVSTIIPVYNRPQMLREAVQSVLNQTYRPIEIIIVDDGSTDVTPQVSEELVSRYPDIIKFVQKENGGPGLAREAGRLIASGEFIQYLDSDDLLLPKKFEWQVRGLTEHPECSVSYGKTRFQVAGQPQSEIPWKRTGEKIDEMFPSFLQSRWWGTSTPLYRRSALDSVGPWTSLKNEEDWEYDCRIASLGAKLNYVPEFISEERDHLLPRLSRGGTSDPGKLSSRAEAHELILNHAQKAGVEVVCPEMKHFARELFLLSRQCGAAGLSKESKKLFHLSRRASGPHCSKGLDYKIYSLMAGFLGWRLTGRLTCYADRFRL